MSQGSSKAKYRLDHTLSSAIRGPKNGINFGATFVDLRCWSLPENELEGSINNRGIGGDREGSLLGAT
jgi:hypothetical protein